MGSGSLGGPTCWPLIHTMKCRRTSPEGRPRASACPCGPDSHHPISLLAHSESCKPGWGGTSCRVQRGQQRPPSLPSKLQAPRQPGQGGRTVPGSPRAPAPFCPRQVPPPQPCQTPPPTITGLLSALPNKDTQAPEAGGLLLVETKSQRSPGLPLPLWGAAPATRSWGLAF